MVNAVLLAYELDANALIIPFGHGLINNTWMVDDGKNSFILQKINTNIFKNPEFISKNIHAVADYLSIHYAGYYFLKPCKTVSGKDLFFIEGDGYYRMFPFVKNSHTINVAENTSQTFEAARKFGELTKLLCDFPIDKLKITLPDFHNISLRYQQFLQAIDNGNKERIKESHDLIEYLKSQKKIVAEYEQIQLSNQFKLRVTHHDTKINNVLFNDEEKGICVIDLDTLMPGYFISDVGDIIRTYISPVDENAKDLSKIKVREDYFTAVAEGYLNEMHDKLSEEELQHFVYAGKFMIYMQALRFLTDFLNNDVYYGSAYEGHNYYRAANQVQLLKLLIEKEEQFSSIVLNIAAKKSASRKKQLS